MPGPGSFTLTYNGQTTGSISYNATAAAVQIALEALSNVDAGDVVVSKLQDSTSAQEWQLEFGGDLGGANLVQTTINTSGVWGMGSVVKIEATDADGSSGSDEVQRVTLSNATGGTFRLAVAGYVTAPLDYNAAAAQVETALESLGSVDNVTVTGNAGGPWSVTFLGTHSGTDVARLDGDASAATAGTVECTISMTYDAAGRLTAASDPDSSSPFDMADTAIERYVYDDIRNGLSSPDGGNVVLDFADSDSDGAPPITLARRYLHGEAVDLQYNRARWYDAEVGRWLSEDPLGFDAGDGNLQRYVGNGVVNGVDPSGLQEQARPGIADVPGAGVGCVRIDRPLNGHSPLLCGGEGSEGARNFLGVRRALESVGYPMSGYVPAPQIHIDHAGALHYTADPEQSPVVGYYP